MLLCQFLVLVITTGKISSSRLSDGLCCCVSFWFWQLRPEKKSSSHLSGGLCCCVSFFSSSSRDVYAKLNVSNLNETNLY